MAIHTIDTMQSNKVKQKKKKSSKRPKPMFNPYISDLNSTYTEKNLQNK